MGQQISEIEKQVVDQQLAVCNKYGADFLLSPFNSFIGVALETFNTFHMPINGLRHPIESDHSANWYIWAGDYSESSDFFKPVHVGHLLEICPKAIKFLGLAPGWRFLFDNIYEDVWFDENLLLI